MYLSFQSHLTSIGLFAFFLKLSNLLSRLRIRCCILAMPLRKQYIYGGFKGPLVRYLSCLDVRYSSCKYFNLSHALKIQPIRGLESSSIFGGIQRVVFHLTFLPLLANDYRNGPKLCAYVSEMAPKLSMNIVRVSCIN